MSQSLYILLCSTKFVFQEDYFSFHLNVQKMLILYSCVQQTVIAYLNGVYLKHDAELGNTRKR